MRPRVDSMLPVLLLPMVLLLSHADVEPADKEAVSGVSIEDFIDLDAPPQPFEPKEGLVLTSQPGGSGGDKKEYPLEGYAFPSQDKSPIGLGPAPPPPPQISNSDVIRPVISQPSMTSDDEDTELSGDGSGSGDGLVEDDGEKQIPVTNATQTTQANVKASEAESNQTSDSPQDLVVGEGGSDLTDEVEESVTLDMNLTVSDVIYTADVWPPVPVVEQTDEETEVERWSPWIRMNDVTEVRVRTCIGGTNACNGTEAEMRTCDAQSNRCDVRDAVVRTVEDEEARKEGSADCQGDSSEEEEDEDQVIRPTQRPTLGPGEIDLQQPEVEPCTFSLFDLKRGKYVVTQWSLTRLVTQAKIKRWCARTGDYLVLISPHAHCQRYYKDLCHVSMRCKGKRDMPKARGDFAEGCWRQFVYGGQLPVGLSNRQTIVYLICQRFAANSALGKVFGHKRSHFATLYDTKERGPVVSLAALTELGDSAWPDTPYFIEHGLVENDDDTTWFLRKARKGIVGLDDLDKCQDDDSCSLGAHQVLPSDYTGTAYRTAHLLWPELAGPDPISRLATFTLTNTAPMHQSLYPAWQKALERVRQFAVDQCGLPVVHPDLFFHSPLAHNHHIHRYYGSVNRPHVPTLYVASGVIPSRDPVETIGNDVTVPFMFWTAFCCVTDDNSTASSSDSIDQKIHKNTYDSGPYFSNTPSSDDKKKHMSFAIYARNTGHGQQNQGQKGPVVMAPVLQLEMLLQDIYKTQPMDPTVNLFPAADGACSELRNDVSLHIDL